MKDIRQSTAFKKDLKRVKKQGKPLEILVQVLETLAAEKTLDPKYKPHALTGNWKNFEECHLQPDWLLIYQVLDNTIDLARTGSHAELFKK